MSSILTIVSHGINVECCTYINYGVERYQPTRIEKENINQMENGGEKERKNAFESRT